MVNLKFELPRNLNCGVVLSFLSAVFCFWVISKQNFIISTDNVHLVVRTGSNVGKGVSSGGSVA